MLFETIYTVVKILCGVYTMIFMLSGHSQEWK